MPTLSEKILKRQLANGKFEKGEPITIKLDQCLLQDATGTVAWLEFEAMGGKCIRPLTVQYIDHNLLQTDNKNMDDHLFLENIATRFGAHVSQPGNGISHHVHKERFTKPGRTMIGSDSHTPTSGGAGMIAIGTGGLDVAIGMATGEYQVRMPEIVGVKLTGKLKPWSTAKDVILEVLRRIGVDGGKGKILEYFGPGVKTLSLSERSTICNMGAETGATTSIFPTDERTKSFFKAQQRLKDYKPLSADKDAEYDDIIEMDLGTIEPLIACPYSPGNVKPIREVAGKEVYQAMIGSSTNSSYEEMMRAAHMIDSKGPHHRTAFHVIPGSRQLLQTMARDSGLLKLLKAKARFAEPSCNACIGMGNAPGTNMISVRSFPRNWKGRSGTACDKVYLSSVETATACAIKGEITDPRDLKLKFPIIKEPKSYVIDDSMIRKPHKHPKVRRGPNITRMEYRKSIDHAMKGKVVIKVGDDVSTDHILPAGAAVLPLRSNIPAISEFTFRPVDSTFVQRCKDSKGGFIVGGANYGQGSSREHAAIAPMYLGIKAVLALDIARIHHKNLINFGILPLTLASRRELKKINQDNTLELKDVHKIIKQGGPVQVRNVSKKTTIHCSLELSDREKQVLLKGGLLNFMRRKVRKLQC